MCFPLLIAILICSVAAQCPYAYTPLNGGTLCSTTTFCQALGGSGYNCMNGQCCRVNGECNVNEIYLFGYQCLQISYEGGPCENTIQCQPNGALSCVNGRCSRVNRDSGVTCSKPGQVPLRQNGQFLNCMYNSCSTGYGCEYNLSINQYICCGSGSRGSDRQNDFIGGKVRMDPGTSRPLKCYGSSDCLFDDTPNCINSQIYNQFVTAGGGQRSISEGIWLADHPTLAFFLLKMIEVKYFRAWLAFLVLQSIGSAFTLLINTNTVLFSYEVNDFSKRVLAILMLTIAIHRLLLIASFDCRELHFFHIIISAIISGHTALEMFYFNVYQLSPAATLSCITALLFSVYSIWGQKEPKSIKKVQRRSGRLFAKHYMEGDLFNPPDTPEVHELKKKL